MTREHQWNDEVVVVAAVADGVDDDDDVDGVVAVAGHAVAIVFVSRRFLSGLGVENQVLERSIMNFNNSTSH